MAGPYPLATLAPTISSSGITAPAYSDILASLIATAQTIFGSDVYLAPDSQDGQLLAIVAKAIDDSNQTLIAIYNGFRPSFAQGTSLSSLVRINGMQRGIATNSTSTGNVVGIAGTVINSGLVQDLNNNQWSLPTQVIIPTGGSISVTVTCTTVGSITAPAGTINTIVNPQYGWQSFVSTVDASPGQPIETDAALRLRQQYSTSMPAQTPLAALKAAMGNISGVTEVAIYENYTDITNSNGLPPHSICVVVQGGNAQLIAQTIGQRKTPGANTFGSTTQLYSDPVTGINYSINFSFLQFTNIGVNVTGHALAGYSSNVAMEIQNAVAGFIDSIPIGSSVQWSRLFPIIYGVVDQATFEITSITVGPLGGPLGTTDVSIAFDHQAHVNNSVTDVVISIS